MGIGARFPGVLAAAGRGEEWAWTELYRELSPAVLGYLSGRGVRDPEDVLGECFVNVVRNLHQFDGDEAAFRSWVFTIAHHRLVEYWRGSRRRALAAVGDEEVLAGLERAPGPAQPDHALIQRAALAELLGRLSAPQRDVVLLRIVHQFSIRETARILGRTEGAVKLLQSRAIKALRRASGSSRPMPEVAEPVTSRGR